MTQMTLFSQEEWGEATRRIFADVGEKIRETRRIQYNLRIILCVCAVVSMFLLYAVALITA
jgi:hypothetical protein